MFKKSLFLGITTAFFSSGGALLYAKFYNDNLFDYSTDLGYLSICGACVFVSVFASIGFWASGMVLKSWAEFVFNFLFTMGTMASITLPINAKIANEIPDFFPIYAIPLHFFPVLVWVTLKPLFFRKALQ